MEQTPSLKETVARKLQIHYQTIKNSPEKTPRCFIGFDGFTDEIISVVHTRPKPSNFKPFSTISEFGQKIQKASGKSCNFELIVRQKKLGGNAPILTSALLEGGHIITFTGPIGLPGNIEPLFQEMAKQCKQVIPLGPSAHSDALEFDDGKIILGKLDSLSNINYETLISAIGKKNLIEELERADLFISANWTMLPMMTELWERIAAEITPLFKQAPITEERKMFVDLADPAKRTDQDLSSAIKALKNLSDSYYVILGLNISEAFRISEIVGIHIKDEGMETIQAIANDLRKKIGIQEIVIHATAYAVSSTEKDSWITHGPFCKKPLLTTGAGDNFNAGFCNAKLYGFTPLECLVCGVATSGFYVRNGRSPSMKELAEFLRKWDNSANSLDH